MKQKFSSIFIGLIALLSPLAGICQDEKSVAAAEPTAYNFILMFIILIAIVLFWAGWVLVRSRKAMIAYKSEKNAGKTIAGTAAMLLGLLLGSVELMAQTEKATETTENISEKIWGMSPWMFYLLTAILIAEMVFIVIQFIKIKSNADRLISESKEAKKMTWLERLNKTKSLDNQSEAAIDLGHDYDGIRELDNPTPPWWNWGFYFSIAFAFIYMWVYFVGKKAPLQLEELAIANEKAEAAKAAYLAQSGNQVDENDIVYLSDQADLTEGENLFQANCAACHRSDGGGMIGPNLTDKYWLHGGTMNDIFKTIKYGITGTGMKAWNNDFSDKQIVQIASFVHSLLGTNPVNPLEPQGELQEEDGQADSVQEDAEPKQS